MNDEEVVYAILRPRTSFAMRLARWAGGWHWLEEVVGTSYGETMLGTGVSWGE